MSRPILIIKTGTAEPEVRRQHGDFEEWIARGLGGSAGLDDSELLVADVFAGESLPALEDVSGAIVTGSASMVSRPDPFTAPTAAWLRDAVSGGMPVLGICYGHQLLAQALGGRVGPNPRGREIGTVRVRLAGDARASDALLGHLPAEVTVHATHVESVLALPPGAVWLGESDAEPNHAFSYGPSAWGVQFHPEFDAEMMRGYVLQRADLLREEGLDADSLHAQVESSPHGASVLRRFSEIVSERERDRL